LRLSLPPSASGPTIHVVAVPGLDPGIDPAIHLHAKRMDPRVKPAGDGRGWINFIGTRSSGRCYDREARIHVRSFPAPFALGPALARD